MAIPDKWEYKTLGDVCLPPQYGWTTSATSSGAMHLLRTTDITSGSINWETVPYCTSEPSDTEKYLLYDGDIVISRAGSVGVSYLIKNPQRAVFASYLIRFRPLINEKFLSYFLQSPDYWQAISEKRLGIAIPNVNASKLKQIPIPVPPFPEQERIVARIESLFTQLDSGVAALKRLQAALKRYRASVLKAACEGRLVPQNPNDEPAEGLLRQILKGRGMEFYKPHKPNGDLPELPRGWIWVAAGDICNCIVPNRDKPKTFSGNIPWITLPDFEERIEINKSKVGLGLTAEEINQYKARIIPKGSVVMSCIGRFGITAVAERDIVVNQQLHAFVIPELILDARYLAYAIRTQIPYMEKLATATTIAYLNKQNCNSVPIPLPPLVEQRRIVKEIERYFSVIEQTEQIISILMRRANRLRQAILQRAFDGRLVI